MNRRTFSKTLAVGAAACFIPISLEAVVSNGRIKKILICILNTNTEPNKDSIDQDDLVVYSRAVVKGVPPINTIIPKDAQAKKLTENIINRDKHTFELIDDEIYDFVIITNEEKIKRFCKNFPNYKSPIETLFKTIHIGEEDKNNVAQYLSDPKNYDFVAECEWRVGVDSLPTFFSQPDWVLPSEIRDKRNKNKHTGKDRHRRINQPGVKRFGKKEEYKIKYEDR